MNDVKRFQAACGYSLKDRAVRPTKIATFSAYKSLPLLCYTQWLSQATILQVNTFLQNKWIPFLRLPIWLPPKRLVWIRHWMP